MFQFEVYQPCDLAKPTYLGTQGTQRKLTESFLWVEVLVAVQKHRTDLNLTPVPAGGSTLSETNPQVHASQAFARGAIGVPALRQLTTQPTG